jgi:hypothetical protein
MYQNPAARLWLIEDVGMYKPTVLRTGEPGQGSGVFRICPSFMKYAVVRAVLRRL